MVTPASIDALFAAFLRDHERVAPTDGELAAFVDSLPRAQRRAALIYARGFLRGCAFRAEVGRERRDADLAVVEARLAALVAVVAALRAEHPPESPD